MNTTTTKTDLAVWTMKPRGEMPAAHDQDNRYPHKEITVRVSAAMWDEVTIEISEVRAEGRQELAWLTLTEDEIDTLRGQLFAASKELMYRRNRHDQQKELEDLREKIKENIEKSNSKELK